MTLLGDLNSLETSGLIRLAQAHPELEYLFRHSLVREAAYRSLLRQDRKQLHRAVGETLERLYPNRLDELAPLLGQHFAAAGEVEKAIHYLLQAGDQARGMYAHQEAIKLYQRALEFLKGRDDHERAARTLMKLGLTYHNAFDFRLARQAYEEGFSLWQKVSEIEPATPPPHAPHALRLAFISDLPTLDPAMSTDTTSTSIIDQLFGGLVTASPEMEVVPEVAQSWEILEGGYKYIFHLRDDALWSDGVPVTAADFEYAWKRVLNPTTGSPVARYLYDVKGARAFHRGQVSDPDQVGVYALDAVTLAVELEEPTSYFLHLITDSAAYAVPRHIIERHGATWTAVEHIVTNGPFRLESWDRHTALILSRNPAYYGRFKGNVQRVEISLLQQGSAMLEAYAADRLDIVDLMSLSAAEMDAARQQHAGEYISVPSPATLHVGFDTKRPPFDDPRVRRAFAMAIDRERSANEVQRGYVLPAMGGFVPPGVPGHSAEIGLPYDPTQARQLLAEAGYSKGGDSGFPPVDLLWIDTLRGALQCEYMQAQWRENLGVQVRWETLEWATYLERLRREPPPLFILIWTADYPDPDSFLRVAIGDRSHWRNETYERLLEEARRVTDQGERIKLYQQADRILIEEAAIIPFYYLRPHMLVKPWVTKFPMSAVEKWSFKDVIIEPHQI